MNVVSSEHPSILTNMTFWQSPEWMARVQSIYKLDPTKGDPDFMPWWKEAWILFRRRKNFDVILTMGVRESFAFSALCWFSRAKCCHIMTEVFIDSPVFRHPLWHLKNLWYRMLARQVTGIITNSTEEIRTNSLRYHLPVDRFRYVPLNTMVRQPEYIPEHDGYYFCAGRTLRDYQTLIEVIRQTSKPWIIVAGGKDMEKANLPDRVTVYREIDRNRYLELLKRAEIVVLPLQVTERATGQLVAMEAMSYGKPVITTNAPGTQDIIVDNFNGVLVAPHDPDEILASIRKLESDPELRERLGRAAVADMKTKFSAQTHTRLRLSAIEQFWIGYSP